VTITINKDQTGYVSRAEANLSDLYFNWDINQGKYYKRLIFNYDNGTTEKDEYYFSFFQLYLKEESSNTWFYYKKN
jgi:hypothetical protein